MYPESVYLTLKGNIIILLDSNVFPNQKNARRFDPCLLGNFRDIIKSWLLFSIPILQYIAPHVLAFLSRFFSRARNIRLYIQVI